MRKYGNIIDIVLGLQKLSSILENRKILKVKVGKYIYNDTNILPI